MNNDIWNYLLNNFVDHDTFRNISHCNKYFRQKFIDHQKMTSQIFITKHPHYETVLSKGLIPFDIDFEKLIHNAYYVSTFDKFCPCLRRETHNNLMFLRMFYTGSWRNAKTYGCFEKNVYLVCAQTNCSQSQVFITLLEHQGDIADAICNIQFSNIPFSN